MLVIYWYISDFFTFIVEMVQTLVGFITTLFDIVYQSILFIGLLLNALPTVFTVSVGGIIALCIFYKVIGREGGE